MTTSSDGPRLSPPTHPITINRANVFCDDDDVVDAFSTSVKILAVALACFVVIATAVIHAALLPYMIIVSAVPVIVVYDYGHWRIIGVFRTFIPVSSYSSSSSYATSGRSYSNIPSYNNNNNDYSRTQSQRTRDSEHDHFGSASWDRSRVHSGRNDQFGSGRGPSSNPPPSSSYQQQQQQQQQPPIPKHNIPSFQPGNNSTFGGSSIPPSFQQPSSSNPFASNTNFGGGNANASGTSSNNPVGGNAQFGIRKK